MIELKITKWITENVQYQCWLQACESVAAAAAVKTCQVLTLCFS